MVPDPDPVAPPGDATLLFEEVLALRERGEPIEWEALAERAGARADELRARLQLMRQFEDLSLLLAEDESAPGAAAPSELGRYELGELLGEGGLSRVYLARDRSLGREVALKLLSPTALPIGEARAWMISEGRSLAQLEHPSIVKVFDVGEHQGFAFIAMERVQGASLFEVLEALRAKARAGAVDGHAPLAVAGAERIAPMVERCRLVERLARALDYCHARGIVHRDVKPGNVLLGADLIPRLIDFGLAHSERHASHLLITQRLTGTVAYFSPEQVDQGKAGASPASDQFSLGVILYELLTLTHPFARTTQAGTMTAISRALPKAPRKLDPAIPVDLERITLHALERSPGDRYASLGALADDLEAFLQHRAIRVQPPSPLKLARLWFRRHRRAVAAVGAGVLAALSLWFGNQLWARASFLRALRAQRASLAAVAEATELEPLFRDLRAQWVRALEHDRALLAGLALPRVSPELRALWKEASARLHAEVDPLYLEAAAQWEVEIRERALLDLQAKWRGVLVEELYSAPLGADHADPLHFLGQVVLPPGGELFHYVPNSLPDFPGLARVADRTHLAQGAYRYLGSDAEGNATESEFRVFLAEPRWTLAPVPLDRELPQPLVALPGQELRVDLTSQRVVHALQPFEISPRPVTWAELRAAFRDGELDAHLDILGRISGSSPGLSMDADAPAIVTWTLARKFLERAGGRLPTAAELHAALREHHVELPARGRFAFEWVSSNFGPSDRDCFMYDYSILDVPSDDPEHKPPGSLVDESRPDSVCPTTCFRVARTRR